MSKKGAFLCSLVELLPFFNILKQYKLEAMFEKEMISVGTALVQLKTFTTSEIY